MRKTFAQALFFIVLILSSNVRADSTPPWVKNAGNIANCINQVPDMGSVTVKEGRLLACFKYYNGTFGAAFCPWFAEKFITPTNKRNVQMLCTPYTPKPQELNPLFKQQLEEQGLLKKAENGTLKGGSTNSESFNPTTDSVYKD